jgi:hypothetical protein
MRTINYKFAQPAAEEGLANSLRSFGSLLATPL